MLGVNNKECWELESCTSLLLRHDELGVLAFPEGPVCPRGMRSPPAAPAGMAVVVLHSVPSLRALLQRYWQRLERSLLPAAWGAQSPPWGLAAACLPGPAGTAGSDGVPGLLDSALWMAAPKKRRSIEVNRCRRRNPSKLIPVKRNIDVCPECGNLKLKHVLCAYCYAKVKAETQLIRKEMGKKEGGPFNAPTVETLVLYDGEKPTEKDEGKRIIERARKRPSWFIQH